MSWGPEAALGARLVFVLVEPQHPGNVGAAARAMRNMGLHRLVLVNPPAYDPEQARWMAPGCDEMLAQARIVATLDEALEGCHMAVATTARHRKSGQTVVEPRPLAESWLAEPDSPTLAVLFGREDFGLDAAAVDRCGRILRIPTAEHASLNLGQAVLLVAHAFFEAARLAGSVDASGREVGGRRVRATAELAPGGAASRRADLRALEPAAADLLALLDRVGYTRGTAPEKVLVTARTALQSADLAEREVYALRGMVSRIQWALDNPGLDWKKTSGD